MSTNTADRLYDPYCDKRWSSEVYQKAKGVVEEVLSSEGTALSFNSIAQAMKQRHPLICDDAIKDRTNPKLPYWKHLVATAISALQKGGKVRKADSGWIRAGVKPLPPPPDGPEKLAEEIVRLSHEDLVQKVKEMGSMLGKAVEGPWGPVYRHDCVWKDNPYANPKLVMEVCDKGNLDKDIASLLWAVKTWGATGILVAFDQSDFQATKRKLAEESHIYPLKADDVLRLHSLLQAGHIQAIRAIFGV
ncbi:MAG: hypothetical protein ISS53_01380 [Dehalococcoidia bacterium]|nr:hypothetical protein [Dehalococcoidia bacterium]